MARRQPKDRRFLWGGTVHVMYKYLGLWIAMCGEHSYAPAHFPRGYKGKMPVNCIECLGFVESDES